MKISDFMRHLAWVVNEMITGPGYRRVLVTARGMPDFMCLPVRSDPEGWILQEYPTALSADHPRPKSHRGHHFARITDFRNHRPKILAEFLPKAGEFHVTRKGWPAFIVRQPSLDDVDMNQSIEYEPAASWPDPTKEQADE